MAIRTHDRLGKYEAHENKMELVEKMEQLSCNTDGMNDESCLKRRQHQLRGNRARCGCSKYKSISFLSGAKESY